MSGYNYKPWGSEEVVYKHGNIQVKIIRINDGHELSLQLHREKREMITLLSGDCGFVLSDMHLDFQKEKFIYIPPQTIHRFIGKRKAELLEVSIGKDDDIIRLKDRYGRIKEANNEKARQTT